MRALEGSVALEIGGGTAQREEGQAVFVPVGAEHRFVGCEHLDVLFLAQPDGPTS